jgi:hypothetical protein
MTDNSFSASAWSASEKIAFRFFAPFFCLVALSGLDLLPLEWAVLPFGKMLGFAHISTEVNGSGDTTLQWLTNLFLVVMALVIALIWSLLDRKRPSYNHFKYWTDAFICFFLLLMLIQYGAAKLFIGQMPVPTEGRLYQRVGDMSPMAMLWTFIGSSKAYQIFCGASEMLAGILLLFKRTRLFGTVVSAAVMFHVFVLNMCYDVPVKQFSFYLFAMSCYLLVPSFGRLWRFFFTNQALSAVETTELYPQKWLFYTQYTVKIALLGLLCFQFGSEFFDSEEEVKTTAKIEGAYRIEKMSGSVDTITWSHVSIRNMFDKKFVFSGKNDETGAYSRYFAKISDSLSTIIIQKSNTDSTEIANLNYAFSDSNHVVIKGLWKTDSVNIQLERRPKREFLLLTRGFHWVNEEPFNR